MTDKPKVGYVVLEADYHRSRDTKLQTLFQGVYPTKDEAERERDEIQEAYERHVEEEGELYDSHTVTISPVHLHRVDELDEMTDEAFEIMTEASDAVAASLFDAELTR